MRSFPGAAPETAAPAGLAPETAMPAAAPAASAQVPSPYRHFAARQWGLLRDGTPLPLTETELARLRGRGETIALPEVEQIYLPLSRLLNFYVGAAQRLYHASNEFLGRSHAKTPYIIGLAGSVAVGKSTTARILRTLLARWPDHPKTTLVTTDGFLHPNHVLRSRGLMERKGFPESYDQRALIRFLSEVKSGVPCVRAPVYSHDSYDIAPGRQVVIDRPDILIVEGLNVLQVASPAPPAPVHPFVSDFFDFKIFLDAAEDVIRRWYVARFLELRATAFQDPAAYFHRFAQLPEQEAVAAAQDIWTRINLANLRRNIGPTRARADLILGKGADHRIEQVWLRKL